MVGVDIKIARIRAGLKQYQVAAQVGVPQTILSAFENGRRAISPDLFRRILQAVDKGAPFPESQRRGERQSIIDAQPIGID